MSSRESVAQGDHVTEAEAHAAAGDDDAALRILDGALARPGHEGFASAVRIAAASTRTGACSTQRRPLPTRPGRDLGDDAPAAV